MTAPTTDPQDLGRRLRAIGFDKSSASKIAHGHISVGPLVAARIWRGLRLKLGPLAAVSDEAAEVFSETMGQ